MALRRPLSNEQQLRRPARSAQSSEGSKWYTRTPAALEGMSLSQREAYVLSRLEPSGSAAEQLADATALQRNQVEACLERLVALGLVAETASSVSDRSEPLRDSATRQMAAQKSAEAPPKPPPLLPPNPVDAEAAASGAVEPDARLLQQGLSKELQQEVGSLFDSLDSLSHYELLGVPQDAERKAVKRAYYDRIANYHPDAYFGKDLGDFTPKLERVFQRMTEAYDALSRKRSRAEYDAYLSAKQATRAAERGECGEVGDDALAEIEQLLLLAQGEWQQPAASSGQDSASEASAAMASQRSRSSQPSLGPEPRSCPYSAPLELPPQNLELKRRALARKLGLAAKPARPPLTPSQRALRAQAAQERKAAAAERFKSLVQQRRQANEQRRVEHYLAAAETALRTGKAAGALNALKLAAARAEDDEQVRARVADLQAQAEAELAETYLSQARYEESNGRYEEAAHSFARAARGRPEPNVFRSAAEAYLRAGTDLRAAAELAKSAVQLAPERVDLRLTLAKVFDAAGMQQSVLQELQRCLELNPDSERVKQWLKRIRMEGV